MENISQNQQDIYIKYQICSIKLTNTSKPKLCTLTLWKNKIVEISNIRQNQDFSQKSQINYSFNEKGDQIKLVLNLNMRVQIIPYFSMQSCNRSQNNQSIGLIIKDYRKSEKYCIQMIASKVTQQLKCLHNYFLKTVWIKGLAHYKVLNSFSQKYCDSKFFQLRDTRNLQTCIAKRVPKKYYRVQYKIYDITKLLKQIQFQNIILSPFIMRYAGFFDDGKYFYLFFAQKPIKTLTQHIQENNKLQSFQTKQIIKNILRVLNQLNSNKIIHKNIRSNSFFIVQKNKKQKVCLAQFQNSQFISQQLINRFPLKIQNGLPPQFIKFNKYYKKDITKSDLFSLGLIFYQMLFKKHLFDQKIFIKRIQNEKVDLEGIQFKLLSAQCLDLLKNLIEFDPQKRFSVCQALKHSYFTFNQKNSEKQNNYLQLNNSPSPIKKFDTLQQKQVGTIDLKHNDKRSRTDRYSAPLNTPINNLRQKKLSFMVNEGNFKRDRMTIIINKQNTVNECEQFWQQSLMEQFTEVTQIEDDISYDYQDNQMNDSHQKIQLKDIRMMKPSLKHSKLKFH